MNSKDKDFDWHAPGVWAAIGPDGIPEYETMASSPYSCRASLIGRKNRRWSALETDGWVIQQYEPAQVLAPQPVLENEQRMVIVNADLLFLVDKDAPLDAVYEVANLMFIPLQAKEGGDPRFIDYAFNGQPTEHAGDPKNYDYDDGFVAPPVLTDVIKVGDQVAVGSVARWQYPHIGERAPDGVAVQLLTRGGVAVRGVWNDLGDYIAWAPMLRRDKDLEERIGL